MSSSPAPAQHGLTAHSHGFGVPPQIRLDRKRSKHVSDFEAVNPREEQWRYLTADALKGLDADKLSDFFEHVSVDADSRVSAKFVDADQSPRGKIALPEDRVAAAAYSSVSKVLLIELPANTKIESPVVVRIAGTDATPSALQIFVIANDFAEADLVIEHSGDAVLSEVIEFDIRDGARLNFVSVQNFEKGSALVASHFSKLSNNSFMRHTLASFGGDLIRVTPITTFAGKGSEVEMNGVYFADAGQHIEHRPFVDHASANCKSRVTYKGALQGNKAHTVWIGDVLIREAAEGTDTYELNRNLLLSDGARADSVPNLEIETGQIEGAGHASASGRFDDEHLFYLQARGITEDDARRLVVLGFLTEIVQRIGLPELQEKLIGIIEAEVNERKN